MRDESRGGADASHSHPESEGTKAMSQPAGWFPDPGTVGQQRYWDGMQWTEHRAPGQPHVSSAPIVQVTAGASTAAFAMPSGTLPGDKSPGAAGFLSFLISGVGQMYAGDVGRGFAWLGGIFVGWFMTFLLSLVFIGLFFIPVMIVLHIWCILDAASCAGKKNYELRMAQSLALVGAQAPYPPGWGAGHLPTPAAALPSESSPLGPHETAAGPESPPA